MKVKLQKAYKPEGTTDELPIGSVAEVSEEAGKKLCSDGTATEYTADEAKKESDTAIKALRDQLVAKDTELESKSKELDLAKKEINVMSMQIKKPDGSEVSDAVKAMRDDPFLVGKAFQFIAAQTLAEYPNVQAAIAKKAIAGMSEGTAADGGNMVIEAVSRIMGMVYAESEFLTRCNKMTLPDQANSMKVMYENSDWWNPSAAPLSTTLTEGADLTPSKLQFGAIDVYPRVPAILAVVTAELLEDVEGLTGEITRVMTMKMPKILEGRAFLGTSASGAQGFAGILHAASAAQVSTQVIANLAAPTLAELQGFPAQIIPAWRKKSKWYMSNALWQVIKGSSSFVSAANIQLQVIDLVNEKLLGYPVEIIEALPSTTPICFGDAGQYTLANGRNGQVMLFSREAYFLSNQLAWRLTQRSGGCVAAAKYTLADSSTVAPFCKYTASGS